MNTNVELTLKWNDFSETSELSQDKFNEIMLDIDKDEILSIELQDNILKVTVSNFELYLEAMEKNTDVKQFLSLTNTIKEKYGLDKEDVIELIERFD